MALPLSAQLRIAVFPFYNVTRIVKNDWLGHGFCESLNNDLTEDNTLSIVDRPDVLAEIRAKGYKIEDMNDEKKAMIVAQSLEVDKFITGQYDLGVNVKVTSKFFDVKTTKEDEKNKYIAEGKFSMTNVYAMYGQIANKALVSFGKRASSSEDVASKGSINVDAYEPYIKAVLQYDESSSPEDYQKAIELFNQAAKMDSNFALAFAGVAKSYAKIGRIQDINFKNDEKAESYKKALQAGLRAVKIDKNLSSAWTALALIYRELKERDKLIDAARRAVSIKPNQYDAYDMMADAFSANFFKANKNIDSAIFYRKKCTDLNPKFASGFRGLGTDYYDKGDYKNSEDAFTRAIALNPKHAGSRDRRGLVYFSKGLYNQANEDFNSAIKLDPKNAFAPVHLGDVLYMLGKYPEAIAAYNDAIRINDKFAVAHNGIAWLYTTARDKAMRNTVKAIESAQMAVTLSENQNASFLFTLAEAQHASGAHDKALLAIDKAIALEPDNIDYKEAQSRYKKKEKNNDYVYVLKRGMQFLKQNRSDDGVKEFEEADKLSPQNAFILFTIAKYYDSKKEYKDAFNYYFKARSCDWDKKYTKEIQPRMTELEPYSK